MDQKQVWNNIAKEWDSFKTTSDPKVSEFVSKSKGNLLDLGCGSGRNFTKSQSIIYGIDFSEEMIKHAQERAKKLQLNVKLEVGDIIKLPYKKDFFDNAIAIAVLHCIPQLENRIKVLKELHRVLKPEGKLLIKVWNRNNKKFKNKGKEKLIKWRDKGERYYYFYEEQELLEQLKSAGFKILEVKSKDKEFELQEIVVLCEK